MPGEGPYQGLLLFEIAFKIKNQIRRNDNYLNIMSRGLLKHRAILRNPLNSSILATDAQVACHQAEN